MGNNRTTINITGLDGYPDMRTDRWSDFTNSREGQQDDYRPTRRNGVADKGSYFEDDYRPTRPNGVADKSSYFEDDFRPTRPNGVADKGSYFEEVPLPGEPSSQNSGIFSYLFGWGSRSNKNAKVQGRPSVEDASRAGSQRSRTHGGPRSAYSEQPSRVIESEDVSGGYSRDRGDLPRHPVQNDVNVNANELKISRRKIASLSDHNNRLEDELLESFKQFHVHKIRADDFAKENTKYKEDLQGLYQVNVSLEKHNRRYKGELQGLYRAKDAIETEFQGVQRELEALKNREKVRAEASEKENREIRSKLEDLTQEKVRADNLEVVNRDYQAKLIKKEEEVGGLQSKLEGALAAKDLGAAELKKLQDSLNDVTRENQELNSSKLELERKTVQDKSSAGQFRTKVADLTYAKVQLEKKELQLTVLVHDQTKRIEELKQQNAVLVVKIGASDSQVQSLLERLHDEKGKVQQRNAEVEELKGKLQLRNTEVEELSGKLQLRNSEVEELRQNLKPEVTIADKEVQVTDDHEQREQAFKAQCSSLEQQVQSKEVEIQSLTLSLSQLNDRLRQSDLEISDLRNRIQDWNSSQDSLEFVAAPLKQFVGGESFVESEATPYLLDRAVQRVHEGAGIFARLLMKAMEQGKIDGMAVARNNFVRSISVGKAAPLKYVLEAITCKLLFQSFEHECFDLQDSTSGYLDMEQQRKDNFRQYKYLNSLDTPEHLVLADDSLFSHFCRIKLESLSAAVPEIEGMVQDIISCLFDRSFSSDESSTDVATYLASKLGSTFVKLAVCVWQVHKLAFAFNPVALIFRVAQSEKFVEKYMESVIFQESESEDEDLTAIDISRVDFMVVPGFLINRIVIRSRVFVVTKPMKSAFEFRNGDPASM